MAKLTVFFKDKAIHSRLFENGIVHIGRDETNDLVIDSLAVAPAHAVIVIKDSECSIKQLHNDFPLIVNGEAIKSGNLNNNDTIAIGKHQIIFNDGEAIDAIPKQLEDLINRDVATLNKEIESDLRIPSANLQVISGNNIGKILPLKNAMTRLGQSDKGVIAIVKRKDGYFVSALEHVHAILINDQPLGNKSAQLNDNDVLVVGDTSLQFFIS